MPTQSRSRTPLLALIVLIVLLMVGVGVFAFLQLSPAAIRPGSSGPTGPGGPESHAGLLTAEAGDTVITLTWQPVQGATGYLVRRDGGRDPLNVKPITQTHYQDIGLTDGRTYTYTVAPVISGTEGRPLPPIGVIPNSK